MYEYLFGRQKKKARPALAEQIDNLKDYDIIFLGFPNRWGRFTDGCLHISGKQRFFREDDYCVLHSCRQRTFKYGKNRCLKMSAINSAWFFNERADGSKIAGQRKT